MMNLKKFYYKDYFDDIDFSNLDSDKNKKVIIRNNAELCKSDSLIVIQPNTYVNETLRMKVEYPGLVTGVGISHEIGVESEFKLGMHFDHTTGMPIVYGSSVKGVIRAYFKEEYHPREGEPGKDEAYIDIFGSDEKHNSSYGKSIYERDIFFDAVIVKSNSQNRILASDSITPHKEGPLKNPNPITFVKIASGCELEFRFRLSSSIINGKVLTPERKLEVFKEILTTYGIGAKTNVGYGQLTLVPNKN